MTRLVSCIRLGDFGCIWLPHRALSGVADAVNRVQGSESCGPRRQNQFEAGRPATQLGNSLGPKKNVFTGLKFFKDSSAIQLD